MRPKHVIEAMKREARAKPIRLDKGENPLERAMRQQVVLGWGVIVSYTIDACGETWHVSAMLSPRGRSSTEEDWANLGKIVAMTGAEGVDEALRAQCADDAPNAPKHWFWPAKSMARSVA